LLFFNFTNSLGKAVCGAISELYVQIARLPLAFKLVSASIGSQEGKSGSTAYIALSNIYPSSRVYVNHI
jgi:hypothetical protein